MIPIRCRSRGWARRLPSLRAPQGHFDGKPGAAGAIMARTIFHLVRELIRQDPSTVIDAVIIVWDMDDQGDARRLGLQQARAEADRWARFRIVLGCPDPMREAWVLAGFDPASGDEQRRLDELRRELGFSPIEEAHRLDARHEQDRRSAKRALRILTCGDADREMRCWSDAPLDRLRARGQQSGLRAFLDEVNARILARL